MPKDDTIEGFVRGARPSDGETTCDSMFSDGHTIRRGTVVFWHQTNVEYNEWRACCRKHAKAEAEQVY